MVSQVVCHLSLPRTVILLRLHQGRDLLEALLAVLALADRRHLSRVVLSPLVLAASILTDCA